jgi:uncharacterized protein YggU (UPF0235/DUF167 family)
LIRFEVHVHPGSRVERVGGSYAGALVVRVRARAVDGAANDAVTTALAAAFNVPSASVSCLRGQRARRKFFHIDGETELLVAALSALLAQA